jgi:AcrR family transcriptional regulator
MSDSISSCTGMVTDVQLPALCFGSSPIASIHLRQIHSGTVNHSIQDLMEDMRVSVKGARRVSEIIQAGVDILMEEGFLALTKRRIATRLGIAHGNVGYYFPSRESLWRAVFDYEIQGYYERHFAQIKLGAGKDAQAVFNQFIIQWVREFGYKEMRILFSQLHAVAELYPLVAEFRDEIFNKLYIETLERVKALTVDGSVKSLQHRVLRMIAAMEGLHVVTGFRPELLEDESFVDGVIVHMNALARGLACESVQ